MFIRFWAVVAVIVAIALAGVMIERHSLWLRRAITLQEYRLRELERERDRLKLRVEELSAPGRLIEALHDDESRRQPATRR
jgi:cell division protein FtsL